MAGRSASLPRHAPQKSLLLAYVLWLFLGIFGGHRYYLGKYFTGFLYTISLGLYFIGWALDFLLLPFMVGRANRRLRAEFAREMAELETVPVLFGDEESRPRAMSSVELAEDFEEDELPAWAQQRSLFSPFTFLLRLGFFMLAPCIFAIGALMLDYYYLLALMALTLVVVGLLGGVNRLVRQYPIINTIPLVKKPLEYLQGFNRFYHENAPFPFLYYLAYPVTAPVVMLFSPKARTEFKKFAVLVGGIVGMIVAPMGLSYFEVYPPHLGPQQAIVDVFAHSFMILCMIVVFIIPCMTSAFTLHARQSRLQIRLLVVIGLISGLPGAIAYQWTERSAQNYNSAELLKQRLATASFREELTASGTMFLNYWAEHAQELTTPLPAAPAQDEELTKKLRRQMAGIVVGTEVRAFKLIAWRDASTGTSWLALGLWPYATYRSPRLLLVRAVGGRLFDKWRDLPPAIQGGFEVRPPTEGGKFSVEEATLLGDWQKAAN